MQVAGTDLSSWILQKEGRLIDWRKTLPHRPVETKKRRNRRHPHGIA